MGHTPAGSSLAHHGKGPRHPARDARAQIGREGLSPLEPPLLAVIGFDVVAGNGMKAADGPTRLHHKPAYRHVAVSRPVFQPELEITEKGEFVLEELGVLLGDPAAQ